MLIRVARADDAAAACNVIRRSIVEFEPHRCDVGSCKHECLVHPEAVLVDPNSGAIEMPLE